MSVESTRFRTILAAVARTVSVTSPVEVDVIHVLVVNNVITVTRALEARTAAPVVGQHIMMERRLRPSPLTTVSAFALMMTGVIQALVKQAILECVEMGVLIVDDFLHSPAESTVVEDYMVRIFRAQSLILLLVLKNYVSAVPAPRACTEAHVAHHNVLCAINAEHPRKQGNALTRSRLAGYCKAGGTLHT